MNIAELSRAVAENKTRELKEKHEAMTPEERSKQATTILDNCNSAILIRQSDKSATD